MLFSVSLSLNQANLWSNPFLGIDPLLPTLPSHPRQRWRQQLMKKFTPLDIFLGGEGAESKKKTNWLGKKKEPKRPMQMVKSTF